HRDHRTERHDDGLGTASDDDPLATTDVVCRIPRRTSRYDAGTCTEAASSVAVIHREAVHATPNHGGSEAFGDAKAARRALRQAALPLASYCGASSRPHPPACLLWGLRPAPHPGLFVRTRCATRGTSSTTSAVAGRCPDPRG